MSALRRSDLRLMGDVHDKWARQAEEHGDIAGAEHHAGAAQRLYRDAGRGRPVAPENLDLADPMASVG